MAFGLPTPYSAAAQAAQIEALQESYGTVPVYAAFSDLPDPAALVDGTVAMVLEIFENGLAGFVLTRSGQWTVPAASLSGTISFAGRRGAGAGELPQDVVVSSGADGVLGDGWALEDARTIARPSGVVVTPIDPSAVEIGPSGAGIWRLAFRVSYSMDATNSGALHRFVLQTDTGSGFADVPNGELARLEQSAPAPVDGISQVGLVVNVPVAVGQRFRAVVRHSSGSPVTYAIEGYAVAANQLSSPTT